MLEMAFIRDAPFAIVGGVAQAASDAAVLRTMPADVAKLESEILKNPEKVEIRAPLGRHHREDRPRVTS